MVGSLQVARALRNANAHPLAQHAGPLVIGRATPSVRSHPREVAKRRERASRQEGLLHHPVPPKKTFVVTYGGEQQDDPTDPSDTFYTFMTKSIDSEIVDTVDKSAFVFVAESIDLSGYMVLDTACQRSCAGTKWMQTHEKLLNNHGLVCHHEPCKDRFQFGAGSCQTALGRCYFPAAFAGQETQGLVLGVSILDLPIPFLASRILLEQLGCIVDMNESKCFARDQAWCFIAAPSSTWSHCCLHQRLPNTGCQVVLLERVGA